MRYKIMCNRSKESPEGKAFWPYLNHGKQITFPSRKSALNYKHKYILNSGYPMAYVDYSVTPCDKNDIDD